jgi:hypothetical protein
MEDRQTDLRDGRSSLSSFRRLPENNCSPANNITATPPAARYCQLAEVE